MLQRRYGQWNNTDMMYVNTSHTEGSKNINTLSGILEYFASCHFTRKDIFLSIGGGVIGGTLRECPLHCICEASILFKCLLRYSLWLMPQ